MQQIGDSKIFDDGARAAVVLPFRGRGTAPEPMRGTDAPHERAARVQKSWRPVRDVMQGLMILAATMLLMEVARRLFSGG